MTEMTLAARVHALKALYGTISIETQHPVASASPDHLYPRGTANDNSINKRFNEKVIRGWNYHNVGPTYYPLILDFGCAGGGMVRTFIEDGCLAIGVEGSDFSKVRHRAEWANIPEFLFTADVTKPFQIRSEKGYLVFDVITMWEFLEHINEGDIEAVLDNAAHHLIRGGEIVASISHRPDYTHEAHFHQTVQPPEWWAAKFNSLGWQNNPLTVHYFAPDWVRGGPDDNTAPGSSHWVLTRV